MEEWFHLDWIVCRISSVFSVRIVFSGGHCLQPLSTKPYLLEGQCFPICFSVIHKPQISPFHSVPFAANQITSSLKTAQRIL